MTVSPLAGRPAPRELLVDPSALVRAYYTWPLDPDDPEQRVVFGTSGHRGSSLRGSFTEAHVAAITQAICDYRRQQGIDGPLYLGKDTHALSAPAEHTALEVLAANGVDTVIQAGDGVTPTPAISRAILVHNRARPGRRADGIVVTPSHNPPRDGGIKYNPPPGGPAETAVTRWIEDRANTLLRAGNRAVKRIPFEAAKRAATTRVDDFLGPYVRDLPRVVDMEVIRGGRLRLAVDPLGGAAGAYWAAINAAYGLDVEITNPVVDPAFAFMTVDHDGEIRMDCSSPYAMARLVELKGRYQVAFGNDPDADRHGIVTADGLMAPNDYLAVAVDHLFRTRSGWPAHAAVGKTVVTSALIDRVAARHRRRLVEVPVGFKWFVAGLLEGSLGFGGEESAGASFLQVDGQAWTTDKDGLVMALLAAEITARTGRHPGEHYRALAAELGRSFYLRLDGPATPAQKARLAALSSEAVQVRTLGGEPVVAVLTRAPGNGEPIGGLKVVAPSGWFAARPSGTENVYKIYAESFKDAAHLQVLVEEARAVVAAALGTPPGAA